ncbi:MAG: fibronectin type III domain-containing protein [Clostridia bacterium]|nr:fibronectin type III domain-containing protein [Clostridia bacterium]
MKKLLSVLLAVTMLLAMGSGLVLFTSSAVEYVKMAMPGFNQYTPAQMDRMAKRVSDNYEYGSDWQFTKDEEGHTIFNVTVPATGDAYGGYNCNMATADKYDQWRKNVLIDGLSPFGDVDLSNKLGFKFKIVNVGDVAFNGSISFCFGSSTKKIAIDFRAADREGDYYVVEWAKTGWYGTTFVGGDAAGGWWRDCQDIPDTYYGGIDQFQIRFENTASMAGKRLSFYIDDFHAYGSVDSAELGRAIQAAKKAEFTASLIETAEDTYKNAESHTQSEIDAITTRLNDAIDEIKFGYEKAKTDLDALLTMADNLDFFDSGYAHYSEVSAADSAYTNPNATLDELRYHIKVVRMLILEELADEDVYSAFDACVNAWQYNYTTKSYKALLSAIDEAWAIYDEDAAGAIVLLDAAYAGLVALPTKSTTADFFDGWTTAAVNDVVDANSVKLCDSIGDGLNKENVWNAGDFTNTTSFEADNNFSMTALDSFAGKSMGWKNMDRSGTLATEANYGYPAFDATGLSKADGIRFKLEADGSVERILIGLSNCAGHSFEQYALRIKPEFVAEDGYINIPFSYFEKAWWGKAFTQDDLDLAIVLIIEAYGVEDGTTITFSDFRGYKELNNATAEDAEKLAAAVAMLQAFDIDGRYSALVAEAAELSLAANYTSDYEEMTDRILEVLYGYKDPDAAIVDVPGFSIFTQEEMDQFPAYDKGGCIFVKTERGMKYSLTNGSWGFVPAKMVDPLTTGFNEFDCYFGRVESFDGKDLIAMLGGYTLNDIIAFRFQVENAVTNKLDQMAIAYKDGVGKENWSGMLTKQHLPQYVDGYFTYYMDEIVEGGNGDWYGDWTKEQIREKAKYGVFELYANVNKDIYGWQVILYEGIDRAALKTALVQYKDLGLDGYADAMTVYYNKDATAAQIADAAAGLVAAATPEAPAAPTVASVTYNSITLNLGPDSIEYRMGEDGEWSGVTEYTGLEANTEYTFYARVAAIGGYNPSAPSTPLVVKTAKAPVTGEVAIEGEAVFGATLTAAVTGIGDEPGELTYVWSNGEEEVGTGSEYTVVASDIGTALTVSVTAANYEGTLVSEPTAAIDKATPVISVNPADVTIMIGDKLGSAQLIGGEASVEGAWAWADPDLIPDAEQSGSTFAAVFTPADAECYKTVTVNVTVVIASNTEECTVADAASGISLTGEFYIGIDPVVKVEEVKAGKPSYLALLRAARDSEGNNLVLFKSVTFESRCYAGTLTLSAQLSPSRAGETYTVWFFADGEVMSAQGVVDANGVISVSGFVADIA